MTAALAGLLRRLGGPGLEHAPGMLLTLIAGVGVRLDSPLQTVRQAPTPCLFLSRQSYSVFDVKKHPPRDGDLHGGFLR